MTREEFEKISELTDIIDYYPLEIKKYDNKLNNILFNIKKIL